MGERGMAIRTGITKQGWENAEFPILCETCLGDNPYVRMMKQNFGCVCKICDRPFTLFRWKAGTQGRFKTTIVCQTCAKVKNLCQTCLFDLDFGLPVELRDKLLEERRVNLPENIACRDYFIDQINQNLDTVKLPYEELKNHPLLEKLQNKSPGNYNRNKAYICSFFVKGTCTRGDECPYRHELPDPDNTYENVDRETNIKNRYHGRNDALATKMIDHLGAHMPKAPQDKNIKTIIVHNCQSIRENELQKFFEKVGVVNQVDKKDKIAMVTFNTRELAEEAMKSFYGKLVINNIMLGLSWQKFIEEEDSDEGLLIPGSKFKLLKKDVTNGKQGKPKAPLLPPKDQENDLKTQHQFLIDMLQSNDKKGAYPSMDPLSMGGVAKKVKKD